jgi:L-alanine-DL-glutamate epimerase-like enolase superfamily enzyme
LLTWTIEERRLELLYNWKISRNESFHKINFFIEIHSQGISGKGEVAPNIRWGETPELIKEQFDVFLKNFSGTPHTLADFSVILNGFTLCNSLRFGIESAFVHYLCHKNKLSIYQLLDIPIPASVFTSYTIPIIPVEEVKTFMEKHRLDRFKSLKIKINSEGLDLVKEVSRNYAGPLRIDANEAWTDV